MEELTISVNISDRPYRLTIPREEEEIVRKAGELVNKALREYAGRYAHKDKQDLLSMAALEFSANALRLRKQVESDRGQMIEKMKNIHVILSETLEGS
ncbi:MAG: cell division protein ZapA [Bacteroidales bacterium]|nr:cell division protein ZapA [Bacteroidales bacterium]